MPTTHILLCGWLLTVVLVHGPGVGDPWFKAHPALHSVDAVHARVPSRFSRVRLCNPMPVAHQAPLSM